MSERVSAIIPVKDGERYLRELLDALEREAVDEVLVIDSGSSDAGVATARAAGARVEEIAPEDFGHGRTRNLAAELATGDVLCFLTQDATPVPGWRAAHLEALALAPDVGASYGPHLPRPGTSPMIARELTEFFGAMAPEGRPVVHGAGDTTFLSNVNAAYRRACWDEIRFRDLAYAEDQAFGRDMLEAGWHKAYHPAAAVLHAHDYPWRQFMQRYFDEYRGLHETTGHVEPFDLRDVVGATRAAVRGDVALVRRHTASRRTAARWAARSAAHHAGRRAFSTLGSRARELPPGLRRRISLERRDDAVAPAVPPVAQSMPAQASRHHLDALLRFRRDGAAPLLPTDASLADRDELRIAVVIPPFREGSGGHRTICTMVRELERLGHTCSIWLDDPIGLDRGTPDSVLRHRIDDWFGPIAAPVHYEYDHWRGADVVVATGWQTVYPVLGLDQVHARAYLVQDHEPEFYPTSVEGRLAAQTYREGLFVIAASPWLLDLVRTRYGADGTSFELGVDTSIYRPVPGIDTEPRTVVFYSRSVTPRRATSLGWLALTELKRRMPDVRVIAFGDDKPSGEPPFVHDHAGIVRPHELAALYSLGTVGVVLSMTNYSLIPQEMMACGLPCVDLAGGCSEAIFGADGPVELADFDPIAMADAVERLLRDDGIRAQRAAAGLAWTEDKTWARAGAAVERGVRDALRTGAATPAAI
jgi:glycosyltransferase involved in cell wall biosynthesis/GT2 family glycosyltransferase